MRYKRYCSDIENVENYEDAKKDNFKGWHCHHRLETHNSDGKRRSVDIAADELKALDMYYNRPADELIFLTIYEHGRLHMKGKHLSEETRKKLSAAHKNISAETRNKMSEAKQNISAETRKKIAEAMKGKKLSEEHKKKIGEAKKGLCWFNNGIKNIMSKECPDGFIPGRIKKP